MLTFLFFVLITVLFFLILGGPSRRHSSNNNRPNNQQSRNTYQKPQEETPEIETQESRIIYYQKKSFENSEAVDVEFKEIKHEDR